MNLASLIMRMINTGIRVNHHSQRKEQADTRIVQAEHRKRISLIKGLQPGPTKDKLLLEELGIKQLEN